MAQSCAWRTEPTTSAQNKRIQTPEGGLQAEWIPQERDTESPTPTTKAKDEESTNTKIFLPYVKGVSERIEKVCHQLNVKTVFKLNGTLRQTLMRVKNKRPEELRRDVVYEVPCHDWNKTYIGETGRSLQEWLKEHRYVVKAANMNNGIAAHAWIHQHQVDWNSARVKTPPTLASAHMQHPPPPVIHLNL